MKVIRGLFGETVDASRVTATADKFSVVNLFDNNSYSRDSRSRFMNIAPTGRLSAHR
jgi:hypothetical protein